MAHVSRRQYFDYLRERLGNVPFSIDDGSLGIWENCKRAWRLHDKNSEFSLVVQDDAIICENFLKKAEKILKEDAVYSFYLGRPRYYESVKFVKENGLKEIVTRHIGNEVALAMRTERIANMIDFCDRHGADRDTWINNWAKARGLKIIYPMPSLIDHRDEATLHNGNKGKYRRVATWFADDKELRKP